jgi:hypothetical protein
MVAIDVEITIGSRKQRRAIDLSQTNQRSWNNLITLEELTHVADLLLKSETHLHKLS